MSGRNCPDQEELRQYASGNLAERDAALEEHFLPCPACETAIRSLDSLTELNDPFITALRKPVRMRFQDFSSDQAFAAAVQHADFESGGWQSRVDLLHPCCTGP